MRKRAAELPKRIYCNISRSIMISIYNRIKFPCVPLYGGFPVKLRTIIGDPIPYNSEDTPFILREKCKVAIENLIKDHQRLPGSIICALVDRLRRRPQKNTIAKEKNAKKSEQLRQSSIIDVKLVQPLLKKHSS